MLDVGKVREEAIALKDKAIALLDAIHEGKEPYEKMQQANEYIKEANTKCDLVKTYQVGQELNTFLTEGIGSLTAGVAKTDTALPKSEWKSFSEFCVAVAAMGNPALKATLESKGVLGADWERKLLQEAVGASGGFLVPIAYQAELFQKAYEDSIVRPRATVIPMAVPQLQMPSLDQTITPAAPKSAFMGGLVFFWTEEGAPKHEVDFKFKLIDLHVHEYSGYLPVTNVLLADSAISLETLIRTQFGKTAVAFEDWHFLNGSGVGQPQGVIYAPATIQVTRAGPGAIVWADIIAMVHAFQPGASGVWVMNHCCIEELTKLQDANANYMWIPNMRDALPGQLVGYPIIRTEKVPALGSKGDIGLYDFSYYLIGDRQQPTVDSSIHYKFIENQTTFRLSARVDGKPWLTAPVQLMPAGAASISPFVDLDVEAQ